LPINADVKAQLIKRYKEIQRLRSRGITLVFPDIDRLEKLMLDIRNAEVIKEKQPLGKPPIQEEYNAFENRAQTKE
jgi:hypothetical protein